MTEDPREFIDWITNTAATEKGGPGSGNWGHVGRPGVVGGSGHGRQEGFSGAGRSGYGHSEGGGSHWSKLLNSLPDSVRAFSKGEVYTGGPGKSQNQMLPKAEAGFRGGKKAPAALGVATGTPEKQNFGASLAAFAKKTSNNNEKWVKSVLDYEKSSTSESILHNLRSVSKGAMVSDPGADGVLLHRKLIKHNRQGWYDLTEAGRKMLEEAPAKKKSFSTGKLTPTQKERVITAYRAGKSAHSQGLGRLPSQDQGFIQVLKEFVMEGTTVIETLAWLKGWDRYQGPAE